MNLPKEERLVVKKLLKQWEKKIFFRTRLSNIVRHIPIRTISSFTFPRHFSFCGRNEVDIASVKLNDKLGNLSVKYWTMCNIFHPLNNATYHRKFTIRLRRPRRFSQQQKNKNWRWWWYKRPRDGGKVEDKGCQNLSIFANNLWSKVSEMPVNTKMAIMIWPPSMYFQYPWNVAILPPTRHVWNSSDR